MTNIIKKVNINFNSYAIEDKNKRQEVYQNQTRELEISIYENAGKYDNRYIIKISNKDKSRYTKISYNEKNKQFCYYTNKFTQYFDFVSKEDEEKYYNALKELEAEKKQKIKDAIAKAKATGKKQVINSYSYENKYSECITVYEMIDGNGYVTKVKDNAY